MVPAMSCGSECSGRDGNGGGGGGSVTRIDVYVQLLRYTFFEFHVDNIVSYINVTLQ